MPEPPRSPRLRLPRRARVTRKSDFERLMRRGRRLADACLMVWGLPNNLPYARFGLVVGRKHGNAVRRNRLRRQLREAFRLSRPRLPAGLDLACAPQAGAKVGVARAAESLVSLADRLAQQYRLPRGGGER